MIKAEDYLPRLVSVPQLPLYGEGGGVGLGTGVNIGDAIITDENQWYAYDEEVPHYDLLLADGGTVKVTEYPLLSAIYPLTALSWDKDSLVPNLFYGYATGLGGSIASDGRVSEDGGISVAYNIGITPDTSSLQNAVWSIFGNAQGNEYILQDTSADIYTSTDGVNWDFFSSKPLSKTTQMARANNVCKFSWRYNDYNYAFRHLGSVWEPIVMGDGSSISANLIDTIDAIDDIAVCVTRDGKLHYTTDSFETTQPLSDAGMFGRKLNIYRHEIGKYILVTTNSIYQIEEGVLSDKLDASDNISGVSFIDSSIIFVTVGRKIIRYIYDTHELLIGVTKGTANPDPNVICAAGKIGCGSAGAADWFVGGEVQLPNLPTASGSPFPYKIVADLQVQP